MDQGVELVGGARPEVVALPLGYRAVDDTDRSLKAGRAQHLGTAGPDSERDEESLLPHLVEQLLDAVGQGGSNRLALGRPAPIVGCGDRAGVRRKPDEAGVAPVTLAHELAQVELTPQGDLGRPRVAGVGVVAPTRRAWPPGPSDR